MSLDPRTIALVRVAVCFCDANWDELSRLRRESEPDRAWREVCLQAQLFCGYPRAIAGYSVLQKAGGLGALEDDEFLREADRPDRGTSLFETIYGDGSDRVRAELASCHPDLEHWIAGHVYGRVLSRPGLDAATRELCSVASLAALGHDRQLASHARGAVRCGATVEQVRATLEAVRDLIGEERAEAASLVIEHFARE